MAAACFATSVHAQAWSQEVSQPTNPQVKKTDKSVPATPQVTTKASTAIKVAATEFVPAKKKKKGSK